MDWNEVREAMERIGATRAKKGDAALCRQALAKNPRRLAIIQSEIIKRRNANQDMRWRR